MALLLFTVGGIALSQAFNVGLFASTDVENIDLALKIVQAKMEEVKNTAFADLSSAGPTPDPRFPNFNVTVAITGTDPKQVDVTVAWNVQGGTTSVGLTTLVSNY